MESCLCASTEYERKYRNYLNCEVDAAAANDDNDNDDDDGDGERVNECKRETSWKSDQIKIISAPSIWLAAIPCTFDVAAFHAPTERNAHSGYEKRVREISNASMHVIVGQLDTDAISTYAEKNIVDEVNGRCARLAHHAFIVNSWANR